MYEKDNFIKWMSENTNISSTSIKKYASAIKSISKDLSKYNSEYMDIYNIKNIDEFNEVQKLCTEVNEIKEKNKRGNNMYSASLNWYKKYLNDIKDDNILVYEEKTKGELFIKEGMKQWKRDRSLVDKVIKNSDYKCEYDVTHQYFKSNKTQRNYVEGHHLIPMEYQDEFNYSLDVEANIVSLCVVCHSLLHHGIIEDKIKILKKLYNLRKKYLKQSGLEIQFCDLINFYNYK